MLLTLSSPSAAPAENSLCFEYASHFQHFDCVFDDEVARRQAAHGARVWFCRMVHVEHETFGGDATETPSGATRARIGRERERESNARSVYARRQTCVHICLRERVGVLNYTLRVFVFVCLKRAVYAAMSESAFACHSPTTRSTVVVLVWSS